MSIEETRQRRAEQKAQAKQQKPTAAAPKRTEQQAPAQVFDLEAIREVIHEVVAAEQEAQAEPLDLNALREIVHEVVAAELEEAQAAQTEPLKAGLQRIYTELAEMRVLLKILTGAVQNQATERQEDEDEQPEDGRVSNEPEPEEAQPYRRREPKPYELGSYASSSTRQGGQS